MFNKNGACVIWAAAASKVINQSLLSGQKPINKSGDNNSALSYCFQFELKSRMASMKSSTVLAHCLVISMRSLSRASPYTEVVGVGGGLKDNLIMIF